MRTALQLLIANDVAEQKSMVYDQLIVHDCWSIEIGCYFFCLGTSSLAIDCNDVLIGCAVFCVLASCLKQGHITGMY